MLQGTPDCRVLQGTGGYYRVLPTVGCYPYAESSCRSRRHRQAPPQAAPPCACVRACACDRRHRQAPPCLPTHAAAQRHTRRCACRTRGGPHGARARCTTGTRTYAVRCSSDATVGVALCTERTGVMSGEVPASCSATSSSSRSKCDPAVPTADRRLWQHCRTALCADGPLGIALAGMA